MFKLHLVGKQIDKNIVKIKRSEGLPCVRCSLIITRNSSNLKFFRKKKNIFAAYNKSEQIIWTDFG